MIFNVIINSTKGYLQVKITLTIRIIKRSIFWLYFMKDKELGFLCLPLSLHF